jgi:predicted cupin superfamily sugar epimerase
MPTSSNASDLTRRHLLGTAGLAGAAALVPSRAHAATGSAMTAEDIRTLLDLKPHPTCGFVRITYVSPQAIPAGALPPPFEAGRPLGSALIFQVTPDAHVKLHRIRNDQFYHYYLGDPIEVLMLKVDGSSALAVCGPDLKAGHQLQLFIPGNTFHTARVIGARQWFLGASTEWPGVEPADVEPGDLEALATNYPAAAAQLREFAKG